MGPFNRAQLSVPWNSFSCSTSGENEGRYLSLKGRPNRRPRDEMEAR